jgi:hypothetical protein
MKQTPAVITKDLPEVPAMKMISLFSKGEFKEEFLLAVKTEFAPFLQKANELANSAATMVISNSTELDAAKGRLLDASSWIKLLETSHKTTKGPLKLLVDILDSEKKNIVDIAEKAKVTLTSKVTFKETMDKQAKEAKLREELAAKQAQDKLILEGTTVISRMVANIKSMIFGGEMVTKNGTSQRPGCFTLDELETVERTVANKLPGVSTFHPDCAIVYSQAVETINRMIIGRKTSILNGETVLSDIEMAAISDSTEILSDQKEQMEAANRKAEKAIEESQKGFRRTIEYEVFDINKVPREYLMVDEAKINEYKVSNRDKILEELKKPEGTGHGFIDGLRFSVKQTSIVR